MALERLPEERLVSALRDVRRVADEFKSAQKMGGDNLRFFPSENESRFDWSGRLNETIPGMGGAGIFQIKLTAEKVLAPVTDLVLEIYTSTDGNSWRRYHFNEIENLVAPFLSYIYFDDVGTANEPHVARWFLSATALANTWFAFKVQALCDDKVAIDVARTA